MVTEVQAQMIPSRKEVLSALTLANNYYFQKWPDPGKVIEAKGRTWNGNIWTRAVYFEGLMALYQIDKKPAYYKYMVDWAEKHEWNLYRGHTTRHADNQCCGQTYIDLYLLEKDEKRIQAIKSSVDLMCASEKIDDWFWIDAFQMSMPVFTALGVISNDTTYFKRMYEMYSYTKYKQGFIGLYNQEENLWWRDKDFIPPYKEPNGHNCYWSRGNGWVLAALVRVLKMLPTTDGHYNEYLQDYKNMCKAILPLQREDGCWNVSLMDPTNYGGKEMTGTSLFVYAFAYGINNGLLDRKDYLPVVVKAWNVLTNDCLHPNGFLGYVQGTGKEPKDGQPVEYDGVPDFEDFGLGCFLLAGSEVYRLKKK